MNRFGRHIFLLLSFDELQPLANSQQTSVIIVPYFILLYICLRDRQIKFTTTNGARLLNTKFSFCRLFACFATISMTRLSPTIDQSQLSLPHGHNTEANYHFFARYLHWLRYWLAEYLFFYKRRPFHSGRLWPNQHFYAGRHINDGFRQHGNAVFHFQILSLLQ